MAKIIYTSGILNGSIGGVTYQKNASGYIVRAKPLGKRYRTNKQTSSNQITGRWTQPWRNLTTAQQILWNDFALANPKTNKWGQVKTISGFNYFTSLNQERISISETEFASPPVYLSPSAVNPFSILTDSNLLRLQFTPAINNSLYATKIFGSFFKNKSSKYKQNYFKLLKTVTSGINTFILLTEQWNNYFGVDFGTYPNKTGTVIWILVQNVRKSSGVVSASLINSVTL